MAVEKEFSFEGQADGTTVTTTTVPAFDAVTGTGGTHSSTRAILGTRSLRVNTAAASWTARYDVTARARTRMRYYIWVVTRPAAVTILSSVQLSTTVRAAVRLDTDGTINLRNATTTVATSTALANGAWHRLDWDADNAGTQTLKIFSGANLHTDTPSQTISGAYNSGTHDRIVIGSSVNTTTEFFMDAIVTDPTQALSSAIWEISLSIPLTMALTQTTSMIGGDFVAEPDKGMAYHLNRLAGTTGLAPTGAANAWAGTTNKALIGALNAKAGTTGLALDGVLNELAGTTGLATLAALAAIEE